MNYKIIKVGDSYDGQANQSGIDLSVVYKTKLEADVIANQLCNEFELVDDLNFVRVVAEYSAFVVSECDE